MTEEEMDNKIVTFGCRLNAYESEAIKKVVQQSGQKNLIIFNSCAVTSQAEQQLRQSVRKARRESPTAKIVVTGCAAQISPKFYAKMTEVDLVLGNQEKNKVESYYNNIDNLKSPDFEMNNDSGVENYDPRSKRDNIDNLDHKNKIFYQHRAKNDSALTVEESCKIKVNDIMSVKETSPQMVSYFENRTRAFLEIQNGCNHRCTFCIIPFGRGNSRSVLFGDIVSQTRKMVESGHKEVVLTGVDISDYGKDLELKITLSQMIKRLLKLVPELPRLRLSSIDVAEIDDGFWHLIENEPRFMPYFHLSVQSGDDMILKRMKRRHTRQQVVDFCRKARKLRPEITFGSDIIAGFPTETQEMFENSLNLIEEAGLIFNHIFPYSKRDGTPAAKMPEINGKIVKERAKQLRKKTKEVLFEFMNKQIGKILRVVVEKDMAGKTDNFLDVAIVFGDKNSVASFKDKPDAKKNIAVNINSKLPKIGDFVNVLIEGIDGDKLVGRVV